MALDASAVAIGYSTSFLNAAQWSLIANGIGHGDEIYTPGSWAVTPSGSGRNLTIAAGSGQGGGVTVITTVAETRNCAALATGTVRYDSLVLRHDWSSKTSDFIVIQGNSSLGLAGSVVRTPGTTYDIPIAILQVTGATTVTIARDYRRTAIRHIVVADIAAIINPKPWNLATAGGNTYQYAPNGIGGYDWSLVSPSSILAATQPAPVNVASAAGYTDLGLTVNTPAAGNFMVTVSGSLQWSTATNLGFSSTVRTMTLRCRTPGGTIVQTMPIDLVLTKGRDRFSFQAQVFLGQKTPLIVEASSTGPYGGVISVDQVVLRVDVITN